MQRVLPASQASVEDNSAVPEILSVVVRVVCHFIDCPGSSVNSYSTRTSPHAQSLHLLKLPCRIAHSSHIHSQLVR